MNNFIIMITTVGVGSVASWILNEKKYSSFNFWGFLFFAIVFSVFIKSVGGFRFTWEKCPCCGKKYSEHEQFKRLKKNEQKT